MFKLNRSNSDYFFLLDYRAFIIACCRKAGIICICQERRKSFTFVQPDSEMNMIGKIAKVLLFPLISRSTFPSVFCMMPIPGSIQGKWFNFPVMVVFFIHSEAGRHTQS